MKTRAIRYGYGDIRRFNELDANQKARVVNAYGQCIRDLQDSRLAVDYEGPRATRLRRHAGNIETYIVEGDRRGTVIFEVADEYGGGMAAAS